MIVSTRRLALMWFVWTLALVASVSASPEPSVANAAKHKSWDLVRSLVNQHADVNAPLGDGATALHWATYWDEGDAVDVLLRAGANVNAANDLGITPLSLAAANGNAVII